jgi:hypothetical protein
MYDDVVNESVPDEFLAFLERADKNSPPNGDAQKKSAEAEPTETVSAGRPVKTEP